MCRAKILYVSFVFVYASYVAAQTRMEINYTMEDGLPSNFVYRAVQDSAGYIWFCTDKGVSKFDGTSFRTFDVSDGLPHNDIFDIGMDKYGKLWLSTFDSICYIKNDSIQYLRTAAPRFDSPVIHKFTHDNNHFLEIRGAGRTVFAENDDVLTKIDPQVFKGQPLIVSSNNDLTYIERNNFKQYIRHYEDGHLMYSNSIHSSKSIFTYGQIRIENNHYLFETDSVYVWTGETLLKHAYTNLWGINPQIYSVKQFNSHIIIQGYEKNLVVDKNLDVTDSLNYLLNKDFNSFIQDTEGNIWMCTNNGVSYISNNDYSSIIYSIPDEEDSFIQLVKDTNKLIYLATKTGKLFNAVPDDDLQLIKDFKTEKIKDITFNQHKNTLFYFDLDKGIFSLDLSKPNNLRTYNDVINAINYGSVKSFDVSEKGDLVMSKGHGVYVYSDEGVERVINRRSYASKFSGNDLFIGTMSGLYSYSNETLAKISEDDFAYVVQNLYIDNEGELWIVPNNEGLWKLDNNSIFDIPEVRQLYVNNLIHDKHNTIWLATTMGLYTLMEDDEDGEYSLMRYGNSYGITENNIVDVSYSNDNIFALTEKQLYKFRNPTTQKEKYSKFHFTDFFVNSIGKSADQLEELRHDENNIEISFNTISYSDLGDFTFHWKLLPANQEWQKTNKSTLLFNSLSPGEYSLIINVEDSEGNYLHKNKQLDFTIHKPWYGSDLFYFICGCLLLLSFYLVNKWIQIVQQKKSDAEYEVQKQFYELRLRAVQAQMNPHFLFNALNSIQRFIYQKSPEEANQYIVKFAKLMRLILESTSKNYSSLKEEIQLLENYIALEQLRFADSFDFHLEIEEDVVPENIQIPSTILQPFVENSINHGLANKEEHGNIWMRFTIRNNNLICEIEDDGIGRDSAKKYRKSNHKSRALEILRERKEVLLKRDNFDFDFYYNDLISDQGHILGTKLILTIPIVDEK